MAKFERICGGNTLFGQPLKLYPDVVMNTTKQTKVQDVKKWLVPPADRILFNVVPHSDHNALENLNRKRKLDNFKKQKKANERVCALTFGREQILHLVPAGRFQQGLLASQLKFLKMEDKIKVKVNYFMAIGKRAMCLFYQSRKFLKLPLSSYPKKNASTLTIVRACSHSAPRINSGISLW